MKVAFLDRDGVINKDPGYVHKAADFEFIEGGISALKQLREQGYELMIMTNQSGIGRGYYSEADYQALTCWYLTQLEEHDIKVKAVFHCPHAPDDDCDCRKPQPGLFTQAKRRFPEINFSESLMVGDKLSDLEAADAVGVGQLVLVAEPSSNEADSAMSLIEGLQLKDYKDKTLVVASLQVFAEKL